MSTKKPSREVKDLYNAYIRKPLRPESALEISSDFVLDLINVFGDRLDAETPLKEGWSRFAPFEFILYLNSVLVRYKALGPDGYDELDESEKTLLHDNGVLLESLVRSPIESHADAFPQEEHYQLPQDVINQLFVLFG